MARIQLSGTQIPTLSKLNIDGEITLDAQSGTSGQILISQGAGNTPAWTSSLTALTGLSSAATVALPISTGGGSGAVGLLSLTGGNTSSTTQNGGAINITGGNATNTTVLNTGGSITIKAGNGNSNQGSGGLVYIDGGTGSVANGNGAVLLGTGTGTDSVTIGKSGITTTVNGTLSASLNSPLLTSVSAIAGGGAEGGQINFARVTDGAQYWYIDSFGTSATPSLRFVENATTQIQIDTGGIVNLSGSLKLRAGTATANTAPLYLASGTNLTTPVYGAIEAATDAVYITNNPGSTSTGPGRGIVHPQQMVLSRANATTSSPAPGTYTVNIFAAGNDVLSVLEAAKTYRFRAKYYLSTAYTSGTYSVTTPLTFSNAPALIKYSFKTYPETPGSTLTRLGAGTSTAIAPLAGSAAASVTTVVEIDGYFNSHATLTSTLTPQLTCQIISGSTSATISAGSWFEIEKLGTSTDTLIAGNWA